MSANRAIGRPDVYKRPDGKWGWRIVVRHAGDEDIVATDGGQGYANKADATMVVQKVLHGEYSPVRQKGDYPMPPDEDQLGVG